MASVQMRNTTVLAPIISVGGKIMRTIPSSQLFAMGGRHTVLQLLREAHADVDGGQQK